MATATVAASRPSEPVLLSPNNRSASPTRVKLAGGGTIRYKSVSFSSLNMFPPPPGVGSPACMCSPTNHPGSFRCGLHKERKREAPAASSCSKPASPPSKRTASPFARLGPVGIGCTKDTGRTLPQLAPMGSGHWARRALAPSPVVRNHPTNHPGSFRCSLHKERKQDSKQNNVDMSCKGTVHRNSI